MFKKYIILAVIVSLVMMLLLTAPVLAGNWSKASVPTNNSALEKASDKQGVGYGTDRPGWGFGDKNHDHTGPPGLQK